MRHNQNQQSKNSRQSEYQSSQDAYRDYSNAGQKWQRHRRNWQDHSQNNPQGFGSQQYGQNFSGGARELTDQDQEFRGQSSLMDGQSRGGQEWSRRRQDQGMGQSFQHAQESRPGSWQDLDRGSNRQAENGRNMDERESQWQQSASFGGGYGQEGEAQYGKSSHGSPSYGVSGKSSSYGDSRQYQENLFSDQFGGQQGRTGTHSGKGPKGYKRNDETIKEEICEVLTRHPMVDASEIDIEVAGGEVTLTGFVSERNMRRMVEDAVEGISGVVDVSNQIKVQKSSGSTQQDSRSQPSQSTSGQQISGQRPQSGQQPSQQQSQQKGSVGDGHERSQNRSDKDRTSEKDRSSRLAS